MKFTANVEGEEITVYCEEANGIKYWYEDESNVVEWCDSNDNQMGYDDITFSTGDDHTQYSTTGQTMTCDTVNQFWQFVARDKKERALPVCNHCNQPISSNQ